MIGIDSNILVAHAIQEHPEHVQVRAHIITLLSAGHGLAITSGILAEFIHIVTDPKRFEQPLDMSDALDWGRFWSGAEEVTVVVPGVTAHAQWLSWIAEHRLGRKRLLDTLFAATWHAAGITELFTLNPRDFQIFGVFAIHTIGPGQ